MPGPIKAKVHATPSKQMATAFFDAKGLISTNNMPRGTMVNANYIVGALGKFFEIFRQRRPMMAEQECFSNGTILRSILPPFSEIGSPPNASCCWKNCRIHLSSPLPIFTSF